MKNVLRIVLITVALTPIALAQGGAKTEQEEDQRVTTVPRGSALGMPIPGNDEAPKALVLVPWKPSDPGKRPEVSTKVEDSMKPIDKEVFVRMLHYHQIAKTNAAPPDTAAVPGRK